jgi:uncharacterized protein involved in exopolysaccharide biosynthesis
MAASSEEFEPFEQFNRILKFWWVVVLAAILGGAAGLGVHRLKPPLYETQAVFIANIDFNKVNFTRPFSPTSTPASSNQSARPTPPTYEFTQYDEDLSLLTVQGSLLKVRPQVIAYAQANGWAIDSASLQANATIERKHPYWELRYRSADPVQAQKLVNYWAQAAFANLQDKQKAGQMPPYILFDLVQLADLPQKPLYFQTNTLVLAGTMIGMIVGLFLLNLPLFSKK